MTINLARNRLFPILRCKKSSMVNRKCFARVLSTSTTRPVILSHTIFEPPLSSSGDEKCPLLITHGLLGSKMNWNSISKAIAKSTNRKVVAFDARNHGDSPHLDNMSYDEMAGDIMDLAHHLNIPKFSLLGHSMGGRTVITFALNHPEYIEKLIIADISPVSIGSDFSEMEGYITGMMNQYFEKEITLSNARKLADKTLESIAKSKPTRAFLLTNLAVNEQGIHWKPNLPVLLKYLKQIREFPPVIKSKSMPNPTLLIRGGLSPYVPDRDIDTIKSMFTNCKIETMENSGHWLHADNPSLFISILTSYLNSS